MDLTGFKDKNGIDIKYGDTVRYNISKRHFWEMEIDWNEFEEHWVLTGINSDVDIM